MKKITLIRANDGDCYERSEWTCYFSVRPLKELNPEIKALNRRIRELFEEARKVYLDNINGPDTWDVNFEDSTEGKRYISFLKSKKIIGAAGDGTYLGTNPVEVYCYQVKSE